MKRLIGLGVLTVLLGTAALAQGTSFDATERMKELVDNSLMTVTALSPHIGYHVQIMNMVT